MKNVVFTSWNANHKSYIMATGEIKDGKMTVTYQRVNKRTERTVPVTEVTSHNKAQMKDIVAQANKYCDKHNIILWTY